MNFSEHATIRKAVLGIIDNLTNTSLRSSVQFKIADQITSLITNSYTLKAQDETPPPSNVDRPLPLGRRLEASIKDVVYRTVSDDLVRQLVADELQKRIPAIALAVMQTPVQVQQGEVTVRYGGLDAPTSGKAAALRSAEANETPAPSAGSVGPHRGSRAEITAAMIRDTRLLLAFFDPSYVGEPHESPLPAEAVAAIRRLKATLLERARAEHDLAAFRQHVAAQEQRTPQPPKVARADIPAEYEYHPEDDSYRRGFVVAVHAERVVHFHIPAGAVLVLRNVSGSPVQGSASGVSGAKG